MRPAHKTISAGVWIVREQACFTLRSRSLEHPNLVLRPLPFRRSQSDSQLLFHTQKGKGISMSTKLYVGNLAFQTTSQDLQELFAQSGTVESASVVEDRDTGRSRGFAFVEMSTAEEATAAIEQFNGKEVGGRALKVNEAKPRENRGGGGGGGRGGFGGGRGGFGGGGNRSGGGNGRRSEPRW
jgi:cold-inducible RNA-binding protein